MSVPSSLVAEVLSTWIRQEASLENPPSPEGWYTTAPSWDEIFATPRRDRALKAWDTRWARQDFIKKHGIDVYTVVRLLRKGWGASDIAEHASLPIKSVRAYKAHYTRGSYNGMLEGCKI